MKEGGQMLVLAIIVAALVLVNSLVIIGGSQTFFQNTAYTVQSSQAIQLAEAGIDKALASLNVSSGTYNGDVEVPFGAGSFSVSVTDSGPGTKIIKSTGYIPSKAQPKVTRTIQTQTRTGKGISFMYGILVGNGGLSMGNDSTINGSIYSNGNVRGGNNEFIAGDVYVAGGTQATADQQSDCADPGCADFIFGRNVAGNDVLDVGQSFRPNTTAVLNKVSLKLKKTGLPANAVVRIMADSSGVPDKDNILAVGTLAASLATDQYGFIEVAFNSAPALSADTLYWIMIAAQAIDNSNYWSWSKDALQGYTRGYLVWSPDWQDKKLVWQVASGDLGFKTWMGGVATSMKMNNGSVIGGSVHANAIDGITINKDAYYQTITNSIIKGRSYPDSPDSPPVAMPISESDITEWQNQAQQYGTVTGDIMGCPGKVGPGKIVGNFTTTSNCTITVLTPVWLTGDLFVGNSAVFKMDPSLGNSSGVIVVDGVTRFSNSDDLLGTGAGGSYLTLLSTYNSQLNGSAAIETGNSSITGILYAPFGILSLANNANFKETVAWQINMGTGTELTYDAGLISTFFSAGPSGSYSLVKGTYQLK